MEAVAGFFATWKPKVDVIVPVVPSNAMRKNQPVIEIARPVSERLKIPLCLSCISKVKSTVQLKDVFDPAKRSQILSGAFSVDRVNTAGKRILIFDDLYRSGATASAIARLLSGLGDASAVYLLTLTQTRRNL